MKILTDTDRMPMGKQHKGKPMQDVPASYMYWLWTDGGPYGALKFQVKTNSVANYIHCNLGALKQEYPDGIWE